MNRVFSSRRFIGSPSAQRQLNPASPQRRGAAQPLWASALLMGTLWAATASSASAATLAVSDATVTEGNSGAVNMVFNVQLSQASATPVTVKFATQDGTAKAGEDYTAWAPTTLTFAPGTTSKAVNVAVKGDVIDEPDESFSLKLSAPTGATIADATGVGAIYDNDTSLITVTGASVTEGNSGTTPLNFTLKLSTPNSRVVTVKAKTTDAPTTPATLNVDYIGLASTNVTFAIGETTKVIPVSVKGDLLDDDNKEYVGFSLSSPVNASIGTVGVGTIVDDDPIPTLGVPDVSVNETNTGTNAVVKVNLSAPSSKPITVKYSTSNGTAVSPADYTAQPLTTLTTLTFAPGQTAKAVNVPIVGDNIDEDDETFQFKLTSSVNATIADATGIVTIVDNDISRVSISGGEVVEGNSGETTSIEFSLYLSNPNSHPVSVNVSAQGSSSAPATEGVDFSLESNPSTVTFAPGQTGAELFVTVIGDDLNEFDEQFELTLTQVINGALDVDSVAQGTIIDDDPAPGFSISDASVTQTYSGTKTASLQVVLSRATGKPTSVQYYTGDESATAPSDYTAVPVTTLNFAPGQTTKTINFTIKSDSSSNPDPDEQFSVYLQNSVNASIVKDTGTLTILDAINTAPIATDVDKAAGGYPVGSRAGAYFDVSELGTDPDGDPLYVTNAYVSDSYGKGSVEFAYDHFRYTYAPVPNNVGQEFNAEVTFTISDGIASSTAKAHIHFYVVNGEYVPPDAKLSGTTTPTRDAVPNKPATIPSGNRS